VTELRHHAVQVPATTANLGPGFDAFGLAVDRYLTVRSLPRDAQPERVRTHMLVGDPAGDHADPAGVDANPASPPELPTDDSNLVWRSLVAFCDHHAVPVPDVAIRATNQIPLERGLGSSSSAIVAGLCLARALTGVEVGDRDLVVLATELEGHPDNVAPALLGGLVACTTDDAGALIMRRVNPTPRLRPLVLVPRERQSTVAARAVVPDTLPRSEVAVQAGRAGHVLAALAGVWPVAIGAAGDRLHEPERLRVMASSGAVIAALRAHGVHAWLSGAGPAVAAAIPAGTAAGAGQLQAAQQIADAHGFTLEHVGFELSGALACPDDGCGLSGAGGCVQCPRRRV
jgi:homoserine kinase